MWHECLLFLKMGGYGPYVWPVYGLAALVLAANVWYTRKQAHALNRRLQARQDAC